VYNANILLINDGSKLLHMLGCVLESKGCRTLVLDQIGEAFAKLNSQSFKLIIMALSEPRICLLPMLLLIKELRPDTRLVLVGKDLQLPVDIQQAVSDFIVLPCRVMEIWQRLRGQLDAPSEATGSPVHGLPGNFTEGLLTKLSLMFYEVRSSLLSISGGMKVLGNDGNSPRQEAFETVVHETHQKISKLVADTEEVINNFLLLEEWCGDLPQKRLTSPQLIGNQKRNINDIKC
jgi:DNA-binding response OmpR family regulator